MDPPRYGYEYWKDFHSDCELVHVMWTDYCGILNEKLVPADSFDMMWRTHAYDQSASDDFIPLTVSAAALTSLPDGKSAAEKIWPSYKTLNLLPDYDTIQPGIDSKTCAAVFGKVMTSNSEFDIQYDPREVLKGVCRKHGFDQGELKIKAALEFQFVLRKLSDGGLHLAKSDGPAQAIVLKLIQALRTHSYGGTGFSIRSSDISVDGVVTIALSMSDGTLEAVDKFYRVKRALESITRPGGLRASFFCPLEDVSTATFSGTPLDVMCGNKLRCRLHLALGPGWEATKFAASIMESDVGATSNPSIYAFCKPNWLTYRQRWQYQGDETPTLEWMACGIRNSKTTINLPNECESRRLEFGDIDCMANMYLVVALIAGLGKESLRVPSFLADVPQGITPSKSKLPKQRAKQLTKSWFIARKMDEHNPNGGLALPQAQRIPLTGLDACRSIKLSLRRCGLSLVEDVLEKYVAVRKTEDKSIVEAVEQGRATSARELLARWY